MGTGRQTITGRRDNNLSVSFPQFHPCSPSLRSLSPSSPYYGKDVEIDVKTEGYWKLLRLDHSEIPILETQPRM